MLYRKINLELIVAEEDAEATIEELNKTLDRLELEHPIFGGDIETVEVEEPGSKRRSALAQTKAAAETAVDVVKAAGETAVDAVKAAGEKVADAFRKVI